jgi:SAM-dependent methyltransferase
MSQPVSDTDALFATAADSWVTRYESRPSLRARYAVVSRVLRDELSVHASSNGSPLRVLDFGSGPGVFAAVASDMADGVVCLDRSQAMLTAGERDEAVLRRLVSRDGGTYRPERVTRIHGDDQSLSEFGPESFQVILAIAVLEYLPSPVRAIGELVQRLRPGGTLLFTMPNGRSILRRIEPPINAAATWIGSRLGSRRLVERACTGSAWRLREVDVRGGIDAAGAVLERTVPLPLALGGVLSRVEPNEMFVVRRRSSVRR